MQEQRPWLKTYNAGIPEEIAPLQHRSLGAMCSEAYQKYQDLPAYSCMGKTLTYGELEATSRAFGAYLLSRHHLAPGERVAIMLPNILAYPVVLHGALRSGLTVVNINPLYTPRELLHQLVDSRTSTIVVLENFAHILEEVLPQTQIKHIIIAKLGDFLGFFKGNLINFAARYIKQMVPKYGLPRSDTLTYALALGEALPFRPHSSDLEDVAFLQYTGGTTGLSKGAMLTHKNILSNIEQARIWIQDLLEERKEVVITALPLYHIFSLTANAMVFLRLGGHNILVPNPRDVEGFIKILQSYPFSVFSGVNTLFNALLNHSEFEKLSFSSLKLSLGGGMAVQKAVAEKWKKTTGCPILQAYGLTETSPAVCINPAHSSFNGSIGLPLPSTEVSLRDNEGQQVSNGEIGELWVKGPQVMKGYWEQDEETALVLKDGWLKTGDMGYMGDGGYVTLVDRKKDMILVSGFNVYPNEVEDVLVQHPGILEAAVIGIPDEKSGEVVKAFLVKREGYSPTPEEIISFSHKQLTGYKVPKAIEFRESLPKTNVGKILRRALKEPEEVSKTSLSAS